MAVADDHTNTDPVPDTGISMVLIPILGISGTPSLPIYFAGGSCDSLIVDKQSWSGNLKGKLKIQVPSDMSKFKITFKTDIALTDIKVRKI